jgi:DHA2 family multidrug resistance protein
MSDAAISAPRIPPLEGSARLLGTIGLSLSSFIIVLDTTIANVSLPSIAGDLGVSPTQGTWIITFFSVANAITVPLTGWLARRVGQVRLFVSSILLFVLASFLCGIAPNLAALIAFRILQGAVAGPLVPLSQALLLESYPREKSSTALSAWSVTILIAPILGPVLGGWITDNLSWPFIFFINLPIGLLAAAIIWSVYRNRESVMQRDPIDKVGLVLLVLWVGSLQVMLDKGKELDWFSSPMIVALAVIALMAFVFFIIWELTERHPVVDLMLFKRRSFTLALIVFSLGFGLYFGGTLLLPLWLQTRMGYTATWAGLTLAPGGLVAMLLSRQVGKLMGRVDLRMLASLCMLDFAAVSFMRAGFPPDASFLTIVLPTFVQGIGIALFFIPLTTLMLTGVAPSRIANATGMSHFARTTCGAFFASTVTTLWDNRATTHHAQLAPIVSSFNDTSTHAIDSLQSAGLSADQAYAVLEGTITNQAYVISTVELFKMSGWLFLACVILLWFVPAPNNTKRLPSAAAAEVAAH